MSSNSNVFRITALDNSDTLYQMSRFEKGSRDSTEDDVVQFQQKMLRKGHAYTDISNKGK